MPEDLAQLIGLRIRRLPEPTREALLTAAALSRPTTGLVAEADLAAAEEADVVRIEPGGRVRFTHPLLASTVYERAPEDRRRELHRDLARRVDEPEERARHLALAATEPDEAVAAVLDEVAATAWARGASQAAADLLEQACRLTPDPDRPTGLEPSVSLPRRLAIGLALLRFVLELLWIAAKGMKNAKGWVGAPARKVGAVARSRSAAGGASG